MLYIQSNELSHYVIQDSTKIDRISKFFRWHRIFIFLAFSKWKLKIEFLIWKFLRAYLETLVMLKNEILRNGHMNRKLSKLAEQNICQVKDGKIWIQFPKSFRIFRAKYIGLGKTFFRIKNILVWHFRTTISKMEFPRPREVAQGYFRLNTTQLTT